MCECFRFKQRQPLAPSLAIWCPLPKPKVTLESGGILDTLSMLSISGEPYAPNSVGEHYPSLLGSHFHSLEIIVRMEVWLWLFHLSYRARRGVGQCPTRQGLTYKMPPSSLANFGMNLSTACAVVAHAH